ncbi:probable peptidoglycan muropeptide transporter SLC46 [Planococcus citri]|uniref:probable peptidoglycan muropeptide transporter SLC46 n=1 Tax=Planococcus citri TaxID=170843 RepID=UPI0031F7F47E
MHSDSTMYTRDSRDTLMIDSAKKQSITSPMVVTKWKRILKTISVEPAMVLFYTNYIITDFINTNLYIQKNCRNDTSREPNLTTDCDNIGRGVGYVNNVNYYFRYSLVSLMVIHTILSLCWSDRAGRKRKPFIVLPIIGQILQILVACFQSYFWYLPPHFAVASDLLFQVLSGGFVLCLNTCITYTNDISSVEERTMKMSIIFALQVICAPIGSGVSGFLLTGLGFFYSYVVCLVLATMSLICGLFLIKDVSIPVEKKPTYLSFFSVADVVDSVKMVFRKSLGSKRPIVMVLLLIHVTVFFNFEGQKSVFYLYFKYRFKWNEKTYSIYVMCKLIGLTFGTFFCSLIMSKYLKIHDGIIGSFASFWDTMASIGYVFANQNWQLYLIPALDIFHGTAIAIHYSFISKYFEYNEYGRLTSALNVFSLFIPVCHPIFSYLFHQTMDTFPSAFFIVGGAFDFVTFLLYGLSYYLCKRIMS